LYEDIIGEVFAVAWSDGNKLLAFLAKALFLGVSAESDVLFKRSRVFVISITPSLPEVSTFHIGDGDGVGGASAGFKELVDVSICMLFCFGVCYVRAAEPELQVPGA
jgi:hypothetical protein